jgi:hypothetical protein
MNKQFLNEISDLVFIKRKQLHMHVDVVIYHPGHFPELNNEILKLYKAEGFRKLMIPSIHNRFLEKNEYEYHSKLLVEMGIPEDVIVPIEGDFKRVDEIVSGAIRNLTRDEKNILLAGKSFFCKRLMLLATLNAREDQVFDVFPLEDERKINEFTWFSSDKGIARVLNEIKEISRIVNESRPKASSFNN